MSEITDNDIAQAMQVYGGSFVSELGKLYRLGDPVNQAKLKAVFREYWDEYRDIVARRRAVRD